MKTLLTIIRHGETEWNIIRRLQGKSDSPLTKTGWEQVKRVAAAIGERNFDKLYSSDLKRSLNTAKEINKFHNLKLETEAGLRERNFGIMEGLNLDEILQKYPETYHNYLDRSEDYQIPEGESLIQFNNRVMSTITELVEINQGKHLLIISHGGILDCIIRHVFSYPLSSRRSFSIYNAGINSFVCDEGLWTLDEWGNTDHLKGITTKSEFN